MDIGLMKKISKELTNALNNLIADLIDKQKINIEVLYPTIYDYISVNEYMLDHDFTTRFRNIPRGLRMRKERKPIREWIQSNGVIDIDVTADFIYLIYLTIKLIEKVIEYPGNLDPFNSNYIVQYIINMRDIVRIIYSVS